MGKKSKFTRTVLDKFLRRKNKWEADLSSEDEVVVPAVRARILPKRRAVLTDRQSPFRGLTPSTNSNECPLDKEELGNNTWSFLHTMAAYYPDQPTEQQRHDMREFFRTFAQFYPCPTCAENFRHELRIMPPMVNCSSELSHWLCLIHNRVNIRLGKPQFDCSRLRERWKDGWKDGSCDF